MYEEKTIINRHFWISFVILSLLARPIHEVGHWIIYKSYGIDVYFTLNQVVPKDIRNFKLLGESGGPLINIFLVLVGFFLINKAKFKEIGLALIITNSLSRLVPYIIIALTGSWKSNDEGIISLVLNLNTYTFYIVLGVFFILSIIGSMRYIKRSNKSIVIQMFIMLIVFTMGILIVEVPQNVFFENYHFNVDEVVKYMQDK